MIYYYLASGEYGGKCDGMWNVPESARWFKFTDDDGYTSWWIQTLPLYTYGVLEEEIPSQVLALDLLIP